MCPTSIFYVTPLIVIGVNDLDIYSTVTVDRFCIFESLPMVCQLFVNGLEINVKTNTIFLKLMKSVNIVVAK